jgi:hypothetical protein
LSGLGVQVGLVRLKFGPDVAGPVASASVRTKREALVRPPTPVVLVNGDMRSRRILVALVGVPANIAGAHALSEEKASMSAPSAALTRMVARDFISLSPRFSGSSGTNGRGQCRTDEMRRFLRRC